MPVRKFRSVADMLGAQPRTPLDPENLRLACSLTHFDYWLHPDAHSRCPEVLIGRGSVALSQGVPAAHSMNKSTPTFVTP